MFRKTLIAGGVLALCGTTVVLYAQPPRGDRGGNAGGGADAAVARLMAFDADKDGKLSKDELGDTRLTALFQRADGNQDGFVTKEELTGQLTKEAAALGNDRGGPGGFGTGPGGPGGGSGGGPGFGGPPAPGTILPPFLQDELRLSEEQKKQLSDLQKEVDTKLGQILSREQRQQLSEMANRGPRGFGGPGGPGGPGGNRGPGGPGGDRGPGGNRPPPDGGRPPRPPQ